MDSKADLTGFERHVIEDKGTEAPFTGLYNGTSEKGTYHCRNCSRPLFLSDHKFASQCGWPSFDDEISGSIRRVADGDGRRTEILCDGCGAHLGHVFHGEHMTAKNLRHCVNSVSLEFRPAPVATPMTALLASGCFWGTEYHFARAKGVLGTRVGFAGGAAANPSYREVCAGDTGHLECVEVVYDPDRTDFETLLRLFFETHDFSQADGQGPDIGPQYLSAVFVGSAEERQLAEEVMAQLRAKGYAVATTIKDRAQFFPADSKHQKYYFRNAKEPYCHLYRKIF